MILAGGKGTRLRPITHIINKHLLPVGPFPMVYWSIMKLKECGIDRILLITHKEDVPQFQKLLGHGEALGVSLSYQIQPQASGISDGLSYAKKFVKTERFIFLLADNIFEDSLAPYVNEFSKQKEGGKVLLKKVTDPERFGIAQLDKSSGRVTHIIEKPDHPDSDYCVTGIYMYDQQVFDFIDRVSPSKRGELEITDVNNLYIKHSTLTYNILNGWWVDAGTHESLHLANRLVYETMNKGEKPGRD